MPVSKVLINNLPYIHASLWKRTLCSTLDFLFVIAINIPIFLVIASMTGGTSDSVTLPNAYNLFPKPMTMLIFSVYMVFSFLIFFCFMPVYYGPQTLFSDLLNIRAITLDGTKPKMHEYFVSYFVVSFLVLFVNIIFFSMACSQELGIQYLLLNKYGTSSSSAENDNMAEAWRYLVKLAFLALVLCQLHYFFTVALSKNKINWLTRWSNLVYIDLGKAKIFEFEIQDPAEIAVKPDADGMMLDEEEMLDEEDDYSEDDLDEDDEASEDGEEEDDLDEDDEASEDGEEEVEGEEDDLDEDDEASEDGEEEVEGEEDETDDEEPSTDEDDK